MSGDDLNEIRCKLGLATGEFGWALGFTGPKRNVSVTIRRMEAGEKEITSFVARLALMFDQHGVPPQFLDPNYQP